MVFYCCYRCDKKSTFHGIALFCQDAKGLNDSHHSTHFVGDLTLLTCSIYNFNIKQCDSQTSDMNWMWTSSKLKQSSMNVTIISFLYDQNSKLIHVKCKLLYINTGCILCVIFLSNIKSTKWIPIANAKWSTSFIKAQCINWFSNKLQISKIAL